MKNMVGDSIGSVTKRKRFQRFALPDGRIVDEMHQPTAERVLDRMKHFGE